MTEEKKKKFTDYYTEDSLLFEKNDDISEYFEDNKEELVLISDKKYKFRKIKENLTIDEIEKLNIKLKNIKKFNFKNCKFNNSHTFKLTSWNVYYKLMNEENKLKNIKSYLSNIKPDILFIQESNFDLPTNNFNNYYHINWSSKNSAISTHFSNNIFELNSNIIKLGFDNNVNILEFKSDDKEKDNSGISNRLILAIKLKHKITQENIIFINLWAPHYINKKKTGKMGKFLIGLNKVIEELYTDSERVIIGGDFNEFYKVNTITEFNVDVLKLKKIKLFLKQRNNTCCGKTNIINNSDLFDNIKPNRAYDLFYDSNKIGSVVNVGDSKISDHLPIIADITI